jgi:nucleoside 2-deoxyribosyltransferase
MRKRIYLAGPISGLTYDGAQDWRTKFSADIDERIECFSPLRGKEFLRSKGVLEGSYPHMLATDAAITGRDRNDCTRADLVLFYLLGAERVSIGTMIELGWADANRIPAVLVMEKEGNPHEHPMVRGTTSFRVDNLQDALRVSELILLAESAGQKSIRVGPGKIIDFPTGVGRIVPIADATGDPNGEGPYIA